MMFSANFYNVGAQRDEIKLINSEEIQTGYLHSKTRMWTLDLSVVMSSVV